MHDRAETPGLSAAVGVSLQKLRRYGFRRLSFFGVLEGCFEADTRAARAYRLWLEGLVAILVFNGCLILDFIFVQGLAWTTMVERTAIITPVALACNFLMRFNPVRWLREGSVAVAMIAICFINILVQGHAAPSNTLFGAICVLITALFAGVVMRLRFAYTVSSVLVMLSAGIWSMAHASGFHQSEAVVGSSLMLIGTAIVLVASYSLEREERLSYLLCLQGDLQAKELACTNAELQRLSSIDKLTGLPNRRALEDRFELLWQECSATGTPLSAIVIDIDHFKIINDVYGHLYGDEALRRIAGLLPNALRGPSDLAARFGGEEFVLLLPHTESEIALTVADRVRRLVETAGTPLVAHPSGETMMWATVSCGVSTCIPACSCNCDQLLAAADYALYTAKRSGRNRIEFYICAEPKHDTPPAVPASRRRDVEISRLPQHITMPEPAMKTAQPQMS